MAGGWKFSKGADGMHIDLDALRRNFGWLAQSDIDNLHAVGFGLSVADTQGKLTLLLLKDTTKVIMFKDGNIEVHGPLNPRDVRVLDKVISSSPTYEFN